YNDLITYAGFFYYYRNQPLPLALVALVIVGSTLTSYTRAKGEAVGIDPNVGYMQRHERAVWLGGCTVLAPITGAFIEPGAARPIYHLAVAGLLILAVLTNITAVWRALFVTRRLRERQAEQLQATLAAQVLGPV